MTRSEAMRRLEKLYGKGKAYYRMLQIITSPEIRAEALQELRDMRAKRDQLDKDVRTWLDAQPFYQVQMEQRRIFTGMIRDLEGRGISHAYRFTIGRNIGWSYEITGEGDTWEEAFHQAQTKEEKKSA